MDILELEKEILGLDDELKFYLANSLFNNINNSYSVEYEKEWIEIAKERAKEFENWNAKVIDGKIVLDKLRKINS